MLVGKIGQDSSFTYMKMCLIPSLSMQDQHRLFKYEIGTWMIKENLLSY